MAIAFAEDIGRRTTDAIAAFGDFCDFVGRTFGWMARTAFGRKGLRQLWPQMFTIGVKGS